MEDTNRRKPFGGVQHSVADDAVFSGSIRMASDGTQQPPYPSWNQFSGIQTQNVSENASTFQWDTFTPPNTPQFGATYPGMNAETEYLSQILSNIRNNPSSIDPDPRLADQSNSLYFEDASLEGHDLYLKTLREWSTSAASNEYDPFNSPDILQSQMSQDSADGKDGSQAKPSYSDIAKSLQSKPMQANKEKEEGNAKKVFPEVPQGGTNKPQFRPIRKPPVTRSYSKGHKGNSDNMESKVTPNSKYGLDSFEDLDDGGIGLDKLKSGSSESIPHLSRKGSTSSVSSGTSGIEEIHLTKPPAFSKKDNPAKAKPSHTLPSQPDIKKDKKAQTEKPFFDPRRIFQTKPQPTTSNSKCHNTECSGATILNNGKPAGTTKSTTTNHKKSTDYINNDLRYERKKSNQTSAKFEPVKKENVANGKVEKKGRHNSSEGQSSGRKKNRGQMSVNSTFDQEYIDEWLNYMVEKGKALFSSAWSGLIAILLLILGLIVYVVSCCINLTIFVWKKVSSFVRTKILQKYFPNLVSNPEVNSKIGLEANITLPTTGNEAMQRLLACRGEDPYSILGLRSDASDDDIRKYYRKQAVLVHPDKNTQPGAEEAFKILGHAFELIGGPDQRRTYDSKLAEAHQTEAAMREFNDLLTKLRDKIQEAANLMRCDNCGGKHRRFPVDRPWYSARYCKRCNIRHSAKEGDVWAETSMFGFLWHYYACMEGKVYDITEWVSCKKDYFKHMQASAHHVFFRIATEGGRNNNQQGRSGYVQY
ncbi:hypothetical protein FSP39_024496 [Pinctada imbricata]|uniref:J domain-containing protein n=1 Tax=Pinctada imbricata TaxID=66713 RepID=A0AA89BS36_PINIB|nr:hypothetical protein FSP39_024496 [Pinctada imbricata]